MKRVPPITSNAKESNNRPLLKISPLLIFLSNEEPNNNKNENNREGIPCGVSY